MPNILAYLVFYSWPLVVYFIFKKQPLAPALIWSMVLGYILLPGRVGLDLPALPEIGRYEIAGLSAAAMCYFKLREQDSYPHLRSVQGLDAAQQMTPAPRSKMNLLIWSMLVVTMISPLFTVMANPDPILGGLIYVPGLRLYDAFSVIGTTFFSVLPFILGKRFLSTPESHFAMLKVLCFAMLGYAFLALWEVRMSPQLNRTIYGYFPHSFAQHIRAGGFRPVVFFDHGLSLGLFLSMSLLSTLAIWRHQKAMGKKTFIWLLFAAWLLFTLVLAKTLGVLVLSLALMPFFFLAGVRGQLILAATLSAVVLFYPMLRGAGYIPTDEIYEIALGHDADRAHSLKYRLDNEDALLAKANERPVTGWGSWGRNHIYDEATGDQISVTDGMWVIIIGMFGWMGYIARFGLLTLPIIFLAFNRRSLDVSYITSGLALVLSLNLVDLLPNAALTPITWLVAGAVAGYCVRATETTHTADETHSASPDPKAEGQKPVMVRQSRQGAGLSTVPDTPPAKPDATDQSVFKQRKKRV